MHGNPLTKITAIFCDAANVCSLLPHLFVIGTHKNHRRPSEKSKGLNMGCLMSRLARARTCRGIHASSRPIAPLGQTVLMSDSEETCEPRCSSPTHSRPTRIPDPLFFLSADKDAHHVVLPSLLPGPLLAHLHQLCRSWTGDPLRGRAGGRSSVRVWTKGLLLQ